MQLQISSQDMALIAKGKELYRNKLVYPQLDAELSGNLLHIKQVYFPKEGASTFDAFLQYMGNAMSNATNGFMEYHDTGVRLQMSIQGEDRVVNLSYDTLDRCLN